jgi:hypothetical protein
LVSLLPAEQFGGRGSSMTVLEEREVETKQAALVVQAEAVAQMLAGQARMAMTAS